MRGGSDIQWELNDISAMPSELSAEERMQTWKKEEKRGMKFYGEQKSQYIG